jgi:hypothetical protein
MFQHACCQREIQVRNGPLGAGPGARVIEYDVVKKLQVIFWMSLHAAP